MYLNSNKSKEIIAYLNDQQISHNCRREDIWWSEKNYFESNALKIANKQPKMSKSEAKANVKAIYQAGITSHHMGCSSTLSATEYDYYKNVQIQRAQQARQQQNVSTVAATGYLLNRLADGFNGQSNSYTSSAYQVPQPQYGVGNASSGYKYTSSAGTNYKYDLSNPADRTLYKYDAASQVRDKYNPRVGIDRSLNQYGGGASQ